jgi:hypothetical protein
MPGDYSRDLLRDDYRKEDGSVHPKELAEGYHQQMRTPPAPPGLTGRYGAPIQGRSSQKGETAAMTITPDDVERYVQEKVKKCQSGGCPHEYTCDGRGKPRALAASCDAALIRYVLGKPNETADIRRHWCEYINSFQNPETGWYEDPASGWVEEKRLRPWLFGFALRALNALGGQPKHPLRFLKEWEDEQRLREWIFAGRDVMHMGIVWLKYLPVVDDRRTRNFKGLFFEVLESDAARVGPERQAWKEVQAKSKNVAASRRVFKDAFHTLFVYYAADRPRRSNETSTGCWPNRTQRGSSSRSQRLRRIRIWTGSIFWQSSPGEWTIEERIPRPRFEGRWM